jgi:diketogulonate reductase-like aldo/keto reductase
VDAGKVRSIGVSNFSVEQVVEAQAVLSRHRIVSNQVRYSLADRGIESRLIPYCQSAGITVIAYSPLARGLSMLKASDRSGALTRVASEARRTEAQVALNWCIRREGVVVIPKANSVAHVEENCGASGWSLSDEQARALEEAFR